MPRSPGASRKALAAHGFSGQGTGVAVADLATGEVIYQRNGARPLLPASTEKLFTTVGALSTLRPDFRFATTVVGVGARAGATWNGDLYLVGSGDPTFSSYDIDALAAQIKARGIRRISGRIRGDETVFDASRWGPWPARYIGVESPPLSGLALDRDTTTNGRDVASPSHSAARALRRALAARGRAGRRPLRGRRAGAQGRARARSRAVRAALADRALHGSAQRQLHGRDGGQGDRRLRGRQRHHGTRHARGGRGRRAHARRGRVAGAPRRRLGALARQPHDRRRAGATARRRRRQPGDREAAGRRPERHGSQRHARSPPARVARSRARQERNAGQRVGPRRLRDGTQRAPLLVRGAHERAGAERLGRPCDPGRDRQAAREALADGLGAALEQALEGLVVEHRNAEVGRPSPASSPGSSRRRRSSCAPRPSS